MRLLIKYALAASLVAIMAWPKTSAQYINTYYHMFGIPQANQLNPSFQPGCNGYFGLPFISSFRFQFVSNSITLGDIFQWDSGLDQNNIFLHPDADREKFLDALRKSNRIRTEIGASILSLGWRSENLFFTLDFTERIMEETSFPEDIMELLIYGNLHQSNFNFSDLAQDISYFHQLAIGLSYNSDDDLQIGIRAKLLLGGTNTTTKNSLMSIKTSIEEWKFNSDVLVNTSIPYLERPPVDNDGYLDLDSLANSDFDLIFGLPDSPEDLLSPSGLKTIGGLKNPGFAVDLGFNYFPIEKLSVSASVVDLGFIRWKNYVWNFHQEIDYTFKGIEVKLEDDDTPQEDKESNFFEFSIGDELLDSIKNITKIKVTQDPYTTMLAGKIYLGVAYNLTEKVRFGGVFRTRIYNNNFYNQFTVSANVQPISMFSASLSYSIYGNSYSNLGLGMSLRLGPLNVYFITDQAPSAYFWPENFTALNFRFGVNVVWGCRAIPKAMKDRPLID